MRTIIIFLLCFVTYFLSSQTESKYSIGAFYVALSDPEQTLSNGQVYTMWEHYLNVSGRYRFAKNWRAGIEVTFAKVVGENIPNPFLLGGATIDYDLLRSKKFNLFLRGGLSVGNLSFAGDEEPTKRFTFNRIIGISLEYKIYKFLHINTGYYNHLPLNKIQYKYGIAHPFFGVRLEL